MEDYRIRRARLADTDGIAALEQLCFAHPWSRAAIFNDLADNKLACYYVAETVEDPEVIGYVGMWNVPPEGNITNVAVLQSFRRHGVADSLLTEMLKDTELAGIADWFLEVRVSNDPAIKLYAKHGFEVSGLRKNYYEDNGEDALLMARHSTLYKE